MRYVAGAADGQPSESNRDDNDEDGAEREGWKRKPQQTDDADDVILAASAMQGRGDSGGNGEQQGDQQSGGGEFHGERVAREHEMRDGVVEADGLAEVAVQHATPVADVLGAEGQVEPVGMAQRGD